MAVNMALKFQSSVVKGLKLKVRKFWGLIPTFVEVTGEDLVDRGFLALPILNRVKVIQTIGQRKGFHRRELQSLAVRGKKLLGQKSLQHLEMMTEKSCNISEKTSHENKDVEPVEPLRISIYQSNIYRTSTKVISIEKT